MFNHFIFVCVSFCGMCVVIENHDAITAADTAAEQLRIRREKEVDAAVSAARSKVVQLEMEEEKPGVEPV